MAEKRLQKELQQCQELESSDLNLQVDLIGGNLFEWNVTFSAPNDDVYMGYRMSIHISFSKKYPFSPPNVKFINKMFHPNISSSCGNICVDILKEQWNPILKVETIVKSISSLLDDPNCNSPLNSDAASMYKRNRSGYDTMVRKTLGIV